jgi:hypothetical protein
MTDNVQVGQLVRLRDECFSPAKWPLGRNVHVHACHDELIQIVTVKTPEVLIVI